VNEPTFPSTGPPPNSIKSISFYHAEKAIATREVHPLRSLIKEENVSGNRCFIIPLASEEFDPTDKNHQLHNNMPGEGLVVN
jgi:hypothetical protein